MYKSQNKKCFMKEENDDKLGVLDNKEGIDNHNREEVYTKVVRAGNRTYFFDVKSTRKADLYLTITESKKKFNKDGKFFFEKHKIFLYKEDFEKFSNGLADAVKFISENLPEMTSTDEVSPDVEERVTTESTDEFINVEFEDLGEK